MALWTEQRSGGTQGAAGPPGPSSSSTPAPNATSGTAIVSYALNGNGPQNIIISGSIGLPTSDPNYDHLREFDIYAVSSTGISTLIVKLISSTVYPATPFSGSTLSYTGILGPQPIAPMSGGTYSVIFVAVNEVGSPTASPFTVSSVVVNALSLSSVSMVEIGPRYSDINGSEHTTMSIVPVVANSQLPVNVTIGIDYDDGNGSQWQGWALFTTSGQAFTTVVYVPTNSADVNWIVLAAPSTVLANVWPPTGTPAGYVSNTLTMVPVGACPATDVYNAGLVADGLGNFLEYYLNSVGVWTWNYHQISWTQPEFNVDPSYWFSSVTVQKGYAGTGTGTVSGGNTLTSSSGPVFTAGQVGYEIHINGVFNTVATYSSSTVVTLTNVVSNGSVGWEVWNPAPDYEGVSDNGGAYYLGRQISDSGTLEGGISTPGSVVNLFGDNPPDWTFPPVTNPDGSTNVYRTFRFRIYAWSRQSQDPLVGGLATLQTQCWSSNTADHLDVTPVAQPSALDLSQANFHTVTGPFSLIGGQFGLTPGGITNVYLGANAVEAGNMAANAVTYANGALTAGVVVDALQGTSGGTVVTGGINIFTGPLYLSQGSAAPVVALLNSGIFLYGTAGSGNTGLTSAPYVAIESSGILVAQSVSGASVYISGSSGTVTLFSSNGSDSSPFITVASTAITIAQNNSSGAEIVIGSGALTLYTQYNSTAAPFVNITASQINLALNSSTGANVVIASGGVTLYSEYNSTAHPYMNLDSSGINIVSGLFETVLGASSIQMAYNGTAYLTLGTTGVAINGSGTSLSIVSGTNSVLLDSTNLIRMNSSASGGHAMNCQIGSQISGPSGLVDGVVYHNGAGGYVVIGGDLSGGNAIPSVSCYETSNIFITMDPTNGFITQGRVSSINYVSVMAPRFLGVQGLPASAPGGGNGAFWYDPSDSNRVKYTP